MSWPPWAELEGTVMGMKSPFEFCASMRRFVTVWAEAAAERPRERKREIRNFLIVISLRSGDVSLRGDERNLPLVDRQHVVGRRLDEDRHGRTRHPSQHVRHRLRREIERGREIERDDQPRG